jgi:hypothetical protein
MRYVAQSGAVKMERAVGKSIAGTTPIQAYTAVCAIILLSIFQYFSSPGVPLFSASKSPELSPRLQRLKASSLFSTLTPLELKIVDDCCTSAAIWPMKSFSTKAKKGRHCI